MPTGWIVRDMNPADLKNHPVNAEIYGTQAQCDQMLASVKEFGVLEPVRVTKDIVILSGHRRNQHARLAKLKTVPVLVARYAISPEEQVIEIVESNRQREKTMEQTAREYGKLSEAKAELARKRMAAGKRANPKEKFPEGIQAKDEAAKEVGMSRPTAEKAKDVVIEIDRRTAAGDLKGAETLRSKLNTETVAAAHREAKPKSAASVNRNGKSTVIAPLYDKQAITKAYGALVRSIDEMARVSSLNNSPQHRECTSCMSKSLDAFNALAKQCDAVHARKAG